MKPEEVALDTIGIVAWALLGLLIGAVASIMVTVIARLMVRQRDRMKLLTRRVRAPQRVFLLLLGTGAAVLIASRATVYVPAPGWRPIFLHVFTIAILLAGAFLLTGVIRSVEDYIVFRAQVPDDAAGAEETPHYRRLRTQMQVIARVLIAVVWLCAVAGALLTFPSLRAMGTSLIASAGLLSIVAGLAAQSSLANIFAGLQMAFSDALRVGDLVVFDEQMGSVEEITLTYVVVRTWDDRRWIVPSSHFTSKAFENWTRREAKLLGTVEFDLDWLVPVEAMRVELVRLVRASELWDGRSANLQVTESVGGVVRLRAVVSAATSGELWDLRCYVREEIINWLQRNAVYALPRTRLEPETTAAPSFAEREDFVDRVVSEWEEEQSVEETQLMPKQSIEDTDENDGLPRWLQSWLVQREKRAPAPEPKPSEETPAETTLSSKSPEARLFSGSPEAEERNRNLSGPSAADMAERAATSERRLRTEEQPAVPAQTSEELTKTRLMPRIE